VGLYRLTGWTLYWNSEVMTFRHKCGWEAYSDELMPQGTLIESIVNHVC
jgi:hypothetical protein